MIKHKQFYNDANESKKILNKGLLKFIVMAADSHNFKNIPSIYYKKQKDLTIAGFVYAQRT